MKPFKQAGRSRRLVVLAILAAALVVAVAWDRASRRAIAADRPNPGTDGVAALRAPPLASASPAAPSDQGAVTGLPASPPAKRLEAEVLFNPFNALGALPSAAAPPPPAVVQRPASAPVAAVFAAVPVAPTAPPLPFTALGLIAGTEVTGGQPVAFLQQQEQLLLVKAGDDIARTYRVESISAQRIEFTYLPLQQRQALVLAQ